MKTQRKLETAVLFGLIALASMPCLSLEVEVAFSSEVEAEAIDGRVILMFSTNSDSEPRFQVRPGVKAIQIFGVDVDGLEPGEAAKFDASIYGYPIESLGNVPQGTYHVQALLHRYETFNRADGHTVKLPMDRGEGQQWNRAPGNLYSAPTRMRIDPSEDRVISIALDQEIPPIEPAEDTKYIKHVKIQSKLLTEFWGRPMHLGACVLLPEGFDEHPDARYPLIVNHGHYPHTFGGFREEPPDDDLEPDYSERFRLEGYNRIQQEMLTGIAPRQLDRGTIPNADRLVGTRQQRRDDVGGLVAVELRPVDARSFEDLGDLRKRGIHENPDHLGAMA